MALLHRSSWVHLCVTSWLQLVINHGGSYDAALLDAIAAALYKAGLQERCGDLYQHLGRSLEVLQAFRKARCSGTISSFSAPVHSWNTLSGAV